MPQQWLAHTTAPHVDPADRRRLDLVIYGATPLGGALCCDATLVSPLTRSGQPQPCAAESDGAALRVAERRKHATYPELSAGGPQRFVVLGVEVGGRWNDGAQRLLRDLVRLRAQCAPPALRRAAMSAWARVEWYVGSGCAASSCRHSAGPTWTAAGNERCGKLVWPGLGPAAAPLGSGGA